MNPLLNLSSIMKPTATEARELQELLEKPDRVEIHGNDTAWAERALSAIKAAAAPMTPGQRLRNAVMGNAVVQEAEDAEENNAPVQRA